MVGGGGVVDARPPMYSEDPSASVSRIVVLGAVVVVVLPLTGRRFAAEFLVLASGLEVKRFLLLPPLSRLLVRDAFCGPLGLATSLMPRLKGNHLD